MLNVIDTFSNHEACLMKPPKAVSHEGSAQKIRQKVAEPALQNIVIAPKTIRDSSMHPISQSGDWLAEALYRSTSPIFRPLG